MKARLDKAPSRPLRALYKKVTAGVQGWEYRAHSHWQKLAGLVLRSTALVKQVLLQNYVPLFRLPYGQRRVDSGAFLSPR